MASCDAGAPPSYDDVTYVSFAQFSLVEQSYPSFKFEATLNKNARGGPTADYRLDARNIAKFHGNYGAANSAKSFYDVLAILRAHHFFAMRFHTPNAYYLDGPEDAIAVSRCGVTTTIATTPYGAEVDLDDIQGRAFVKLESDLRNAIVSDQWNKIASPK